MFKTNLIAAAIINAFILFIFSLGDARGHSESEEHHEVGHAVHETEIAHEDAAPVAMQEVEHEPEDTEQKATDAWRDKFEEGSWEWELLDFLDSDELAKMVTLERVPFEGEELPAEGVIELDHLAEIHTAFPFLNIEVQAHSTQAKNEVGRKAKRATCKARALWVKSKLKSRGIPGDNLTSQGMADDNLLQGIDPEDKSQRRITVLIQK